MEDHMHSSRALSKGASSEPSFRVLYYGDKGAAVPFKWESQPGTPKHALYSDYSALPPLTPPPSYLSPPDPCPKTTSHRRRRMRKVVVLLGFLPRLVRRGSHVSPTSSYPGSCETTSYHSKGWKTRRPLVVALMGDEEEEGVCSGGRLRRLKNAVLSVVGRRRRSASVGYLG